MATPLEAVREAVIKAVPSISKQISDNVFQVLGRPIQLADVLIAISKIPNLYILVSDNGTFHKRIAPMQHEEVCRWDLYEDLDHQSEATILFIKSLLVKE